MAILTASGRSAMASAIKSRPLFLGWGSGQSWWDSTITQTKTFVNDALATQYGNLASIQVTSLDGQTVYTSGVDYTVDANAGIVTRKGTGRITAGASVIVTYVPSHPAEDPNTAALITPVGYRKVTEVDFVTEDSVNGTIQLTSGRYAVSASPTPELYTRTSYDYEDGSGSTIRELALFQDCVVNSALPAGQQYFTPAQLTAPGLLLAVQNITPLTRNSAVKQSFEFVLVL